MSLRTVLMAALLLTLSRNGAALECREPDAFALLPTEAESLPDWNDELVRLVADGDVVLDRAELVPREGRAAEPAFVLKRDREERRVRLLTCEDLSEWMRAMATPEPISSGGYVYEWRYDQLFYRNVPIATDSTRTIGCPAIQDDLPPMEGADEAESECLEQSGQTVELIGPWVLVQRGSASWCGGVQPERDGSWQVLFVGPGAEPTLEHAIDLPSLADSLKARPIDLRASSSPVTEAADLLRAPHYYSGYDQIRDVVEITFGINPPFCGSCLNEPEAYRFEARVTSPRLRTLLRQVFPAEPDAQALYPRRSSCGVSAG